MYSAARQRRRNQYSKGEQKKKGGASFMSDTGERILELFSKTLPGMSEPEKERLLWFGEGVLAAVRAQSAGAAQDST